MSRALSETFGRFLAVGALCFFIDAGIVTLGILAGFGRIESRVVSFLVAASVAYRLQRRFTFRTRGPAHLREWGQFVMVNALGAAINFGIYVALIRESAVCYRFPAIAVLAGAVVAALFNFALSARFLGTSGAGPGERPDVLSDDVLQSQPVEQATDRKGDTVEQTH